MRTEEESSPTAGLGLARWRIVAMLMSFSFMSHFHRISMSVAGNRIIDEYGISPQRMGWVYSSLLIAYAVCMTPGGWLTDRWGAWKALVFVGFGTALFSALTGLAGHPALGVGLLIPMLVLARVAMGVFQAPIYPAAGRIVSHWIPFRHRGMTNGLVTGSSGVGVALAYPLFASLIVGFGWRVAFLIVGGITAVLAGLWTWIGANDPPGGRLLDSGDPRERISPDGAVAKAGTWRLLLHNRSLWLLTVSYATVGYIEYLVFYWSEYYFKTVLQFSERGSQVSAMLPPLTMAVGIPLGGWLSDRLVGILGYRRGRATVAFGGMVASATLLSSATLTTDPYAIVACFALSLGAIGMTEGPAWATAIDLGGHRGGTSSAIVNTGGNAGGFVAPVVTPWVGALLTPWLGRELSWAWGLRLGGLICLLGAFLWFWIDASERVEEERVGLEAR